MNKVNKKKNNMFLRFIPALIIVMLTLCLTACQSKEPITADSFNEKMEELGYTVIDITDQFADYPQILKGLGCEMDGVHVEFYEIDSNDKTTAFFNGNKMQIETYKGNVSTESSVSMGNYAKYALKTSEMYYIVERVETTVIYAYSDKSESDKLDDIIKELGY